MKTILLIRHAETDLAGTFCGHSDPNLNEKGRDQVATMLRHLESISIGAIYASDLLRAQATAQALAAQRRLQIRPQAALREIYFGQWEGLTWTQVEARDRAFAARWVESFPDLPAPGGEAMVHFKHRVFAAIHNIAEELNTSPMEQVAVVTHAGVLRLILQRLYSVKPEAAWERSSKYCSVMRLPLPDVMIAGSRPYLSGESV
jgi:alpha-ribazole phosphatase